MSVHLMHGAHGCTSDRVTIYRFGLVLLRMLLCVSYNDNLCRTGKMSNQSMWLTDTNLYLNYTNFNLFSELTCSLVRLNKV